MKINKTDLTQDFLKTVLDYNPDTGHLTWKTKKYSKSVFKGHRAGSVHKSGYRLITLFGTTYREHQLIWFYVHGYWAEIIDHINQQTDDNRLCNLREVSHAENMKNLPLYKNSSTGIQGIYLNKYKDTWTSIIKHKGKKVFQKQYPYDELDRAIEERRAKLDELGFHINHGKRKEIL